MIDNHIPTKVVKPNNNHKKFRDDLLSVIKKYPDLPSDEILSLVSHFVGQLIAFQDHTKITPEIALEIVRKNIEHGNKEALSTYSITNFFANNEIKAKH